MANNISFQPMGKTIAAAASNASVANYSVTADSPSNQYLLVNTDATNDVYVWISPNTSPINVAIATGDGANAGYSIPILHGTARIITSAQCSNSKTVQISVLCKAGTPSLMVTPGEGL